jgi:hypothetical protein
MKINPNGTPENKPIFNPFLTHYRRRMRAITTALRAMTIHAYVHNNLKSACLT